MIFKNVFISTIFCFGLLFKIFNAILFGTQYVTVDWLFFILASDIIFMYLLIQFQCDQSLGIALKSWIETEADENGVCVIAYPPTNFPNLRKFLREKISAISLWESYSVKILYESGKLSFCDYSSSWFWYYAFTFGC